MSDELPDHSFSKVLIDWDHVSVLKTITVQGMECLILIILKELPYCNDKHVFSYQLSLIAFYH